MPLLEKHLIIKRSTIPGAGKGLFTKKLIPKGSRIIEYTGKITTWKNVDHNDGLNAYIYYMHRNHVIDASRSKKSLARYVNDARGSAKIKGVSNNSIYLRDGEKVFIESKKNIPANTEILVGYGKEYWDTISKNRKLSEKEKKYKEKE